MSRAARPPVAIGAGLVLLSATALVVAIATGGFLAGIGPFELLITETTATVAFIVTALGTVILAFSARYTIDDPAPARLHWLMLAAVAAAGVAATAATILGFAVAWILTTLALTALLAHRPAAAGGRAGVVRSITPLLIGDAMFVVAIAIVLGASGNASMGDLGAVAGDLGDNATLVAILLVGAALARCAQAPFGAWMTGTLGAPTPVSALLHAGIVNAGGLLIVLTAPIVFASGAAVWLLFAVAGVTMLMGTSLMTARPDVKGALALSTRGQMAFMLLQCAIGAFAAAIFHLLAHGMYKAYLFLGSGGAIAERRALESAPHLAIPAASGGRAARQAAIAVLAPAALIALAVVTVAPSLGEDTSGVVLLLFAWATGAQASWWWLRLRGPSGAARVAALGGLAAATLAYVGLLSLAKETFTADLPVPADGAVPALAIVPIVLAAVAVTGLRWVSVARGGRSIGPGLAALNRRAYAAALGRGSWTPFRGGSAVAALATRRTSRTTIGEPDSALEAR